MYYLFHFDVSRTTNTYNLKLTSKIYSTNRIMMRLSMLAVALQLLLLCGHFSKSTIAKPHERHHQHEHLISTSRRTYEDDKYFSIDDNLYIKESNHMFAHGGVASASTSSASASGSRQENIWNTIQNLDNNYKVPPFYET